MTPSIDDHIQELRARVEALERAVAVKPRKSRERYPSPIQDDYSDRERLWKAYLDLSWEVVAVTGKRPTKIGFASAHARSINERTVRRWLNRNETRPIGVGSAPDGNIRAALAEDIDRIRAQRKSGESGERMDSHMIPGGAALRS